MGEKKTNGMIRCANKCYASKRSVSNAPMIVRDAIQCLEKSVVHVTQLSEEFSTPRDRPEALIGLLDIGHLPDRASYYTVVAFQVFLT